MFIKSFGGKLNTSHALGMKWQDEPEKIKENSQTHIRGKVSNFEYQPAVYGTYTTVATAAAAEVVVRCIRTVLALKRVRLDKMRLLRKTHNSNAFEQHTYIHSHRHTDTHHAHCFVAWGEVHPDYVKFADT